MRRLGCTFLFLVRAFALGMIASSVHAAPAPAPPPHKPQDTLRNMLWGSREHHSDAPRRPEEPLTARYQPDQGRGFVLDRTTSQVLLRFDDSAEIWILHSQPGPRGDTIYRNDVGQPVLRATKLGGLTLFTDSSPQGSAAAFGGDGQSLRLPKFMGPHAMFELVLQADDRSSRAAQRFIPFSMVNDATPETAPVVTEAAIVTSEAIVRVSRAPNGHTILTLVSRVLLARGGKADVQLSSGALTVTYSLDNTGGAWPSSERIFETIAK